MAGYIYLVQMDIPNEMEAEFNRIYDTQHVPNIIKVPGVHGCVRYKLASADVEGVARYAAVYDIDSPDIPETDGWKAESDKGDWPGQIRPHTSNRSHLIFQRIS